ncbi:hypothetical protein MCC93_19270 [Morococcus cerebrosus]|uniref:Uncharacterized protein n=1 Tax=Morococcus cerebrosus TaxID=1056807 RepID=A0A0C1ED41_9NEIS|nr:hypothetical protein MCC93_19270 [Morococcus cerebrosus]
MKIQKLSHILLISIENPILIYRKGQTTPAVYTSRTKKAGHIKRAQTKRNAIPYFRPPFITAINGNGAYS